MEKEEKIIEEVTEVSKNVAFGLVSSSNLDEFNSLVNDLKVSKDKLKSIKKTITKQHKETFKELVNTIEELTSVVQEKIDLLINSNI